MGKLNTSLNKYYRMLWSSDQHLLHPNTPTAHILKNLTKFFYVDNKLQETDLVVFGGDLFDSICETPDANMQLCRVWLQKFLDDCDSNKVIVRFLEGTSSHDRGQPIVIETMKPYGSDLIKYVDTLSIEHIPELDLTVMYVPDNFGHISADVIYERALELLAQNNLTQVDMIYLHGGFDYQLPPVANKGNLYDSLKWSKLARLGIFSGHIHKPSSKYNIRSSGSFDRLIHGEMHPKGGYIVDFNKEELHATFYENVGAMIYDTISVTKETTEMELVNKIDKYLGKRPPYGTSIRISGGLSNVVNPIVTHYKETRPEYTFVSDNAKEKQVEISEELYTTEMIKGIVTTKENLPDSLFEFMENDIKNNPDIDPVFLRELLAEAING